MRAITFQFRTEQPVLATSFQGDPNSDVSYPYIPGSMIRGALIGRYLKNNPSKNTDIVNDENIRYLFFNGKTRYLNAYLSTQDLYKIHIRNLPIPFSWFKDKSDEIPMQIYDLSRMDLTDLPKNVSPKKLTEGFCTVSDHNMTIYNVKKRINIHNQRHRRRGSSTEETGEIFRYEAIDKGQTFQGIVLCDYTDTETIETLLQQDKNLWLGGSQSAGYGHTLIDIKGVKVHEIKNGEDWNEIDIEVNKRITQQKLQITLLSDLIFQNDYGQYDVETPTKLLAEILNLEEQQLKLCKSYIGNTLVGGFNKKWGLPLPQVPAIAAGSVFVFDNLQLSPEQLFNLEWQGIGERRVDGFGRVAVNWLNLDQSAVFDAKKPSQDTYSTEEPSLKKDSVSAKLANEMAQRLLRQKLDNLLMNKVVTIDLTGRISNSQLSRLMIVARQALYENCNLELIKSLLDNLPSNASNQFEKVEAQIRVWIKKPGDWLGSQTINIAGETFSLTEEVKKEYTLRLIMAVAKKASKENNND